VRTSGPIFCSTSKNAVKAKFTGIAHPLIAPSRCPKPSPNHSACVSLVSAYTNNLRMALLLRGVISSSPAVLGLSGRGYGLSFAGFGGAA
jgi:hypothetical protein